MPIVDSKNNVSLKMLYFQLKKICTLTCKNYVTCKAPTRHEENGCDYSLHTVKNMSLASDGENPAVS